MAICSGRVAPCDLDDLSNAQPIAQAFVQQIIFGEHDKKKMGLRNSRELESWALLIDCLLRGETAAGLDVAMQRLKALERSIVDGSWSVARWYELIPTSASHLTDRHEALAAMRLEKSEQDLRKKPKVGEKESG